MRSKPVLKAVAAIVNAAIGYAAAQQVLSRVDGQSHGVVVAVVKPQRQYKWPGTSPHKVKVKLSDGQLVDVAATRSGQDLIGQSLTLTRHVTPWGQTWYSAEN